MLRKTTCLGPFKLRAKAGKVRERIQTYKTMYEKNQAKKVFSLSGYIITQDQPNTSKIQKIWMW